MARKLLLTDIIALTLLLLFFILALLVPITVPNSTQESMLVVGMVITFISYIISIAILSLLVTINYNQIKKEIK
jgi:hypothetical protein